MHQRTSPAIGAGFGQLAEPGLSGVTREAVSGLTGAVAGGGMSVQTEWFFTPSDNVCRVPPQQDVTRIDLPEMVIQGGQD